MGHGVLRGKPRVNEAAPALRSYAILLDSAKASLRKHSKKRTHSQNTHQIHEGTNQSQRVVIARELLARGGNGERS